MNIKDGRNDFENENITSRAEAALCRSACDQMSKSSYDSMVERHERMLRQRRENEINRVRDWIREQR